VAGKPPGRDEDGVAPQIQGRRARVARKPDARRPADAASLGRGDRLSRCVEVVARLDLDENDRRAAPHDEIDFASGRREARASAW
jgi:hypothetical protein